MKFLISLYLLIFTISIYSQVEDTVKVNDWNIYGYPYAFYTPETSLALGAAGMALFKFDDDYNSFPSSIYLSSYYTINNQYEIIFKPEIWRHNNKYRVVLNAGYSNFIDKFFGIGNNSPDYDNAAYQFTNLSLNADFQYSILQHLKIGIANEFSYFSISDKRSNFLLNDNSLYGLDGGNVSGFGLSLFYDSRNSIFYPTNGDYIDVRFLAFEKWMGSDYTFNKFVLDIRKYLSLGEGKVIATNIYTSLMNGSVPYFKLNLLGGLERMRGYYMGRFRDKHYLAFQSELRWDIWWRFRAVGFIGFGQVAPEIESFKLNELKPSYGVGLRFILDEAENLDLRADFGFGDSGGGLYLAIKQAF